MKLLMQISKKKSQQTIGKVDEAQICSDFCGSTVVMLTVVKLILQT